MRGGQAVNHDFQNELPESRWDVGLPELDEPPSELVLPEFLALPLSKRERVWITQLKRSLGTFMATTQPLSLKPNAFEGTRYRRLARVVREAAATLFDERLRAHRAFLGENEVLQRSFRQDLARQVKSVFSELLWVDETGEPAFDSDTWWVLWLTLDTALQNTWRQTARPGSIQPRFGLNLRRVLLARGIKISAFAQRIGYSREAAMKVLRGESVPRCPADYADGVSMSLEQLLNF
jgi:hypothetical protein